MTVGSAAGLFVDVSPFSTGTTIMEYHPEIFEPYDHLIEITICGEKKLVPENNSILRCLQYLDMERISNADLCWNGDCGDCQVWLEKEGREKPVISCRTRAAEGMIITRLAPALQEGPSK